MAAAPAPLPESEPDAPRERRWWPQGTAYLSQSRRPLVSLAFIMPLLALYEGGVLWLGPSAMRNGADVWLRRLLDELGLAHYFLLPVLTIGLLLAWHHLTHEPWQVSRDVLVAMYVECSLLAVVLLGIGHLQRHLTQFAIAGAGWEVAPSMAAALPWASTAAGTGEHWGFLARLVGFCGAGIYEEVLFRLMLMPLVVAIAGVFVGERSWRVAIAVVLTSVAFSAAHYLGVQGESFAWFSFSFRFLAGAFFALLFVYRGFGIAAGTHALYDIFVGLG